MHDSPAPPIDSHAKGRHCAGVAALSVVVLYVLFAVPLILFTPPGNRAGEDESQYHLPAILKFASEWPHFDFRSYTSATTPGYHLVLATVARFVSDNVHVLRAAGAVFTMGLLVTLAAGLARRVGAREAIALCLPVVCSSYVFKSGVWILPENAAWWGLLAVLLLALRHKVDATSYVAGGVLLAALVFVRQMHLWSASLLWLAAWLGGSGSTVDRSTESALPHRFARAAVMFLATLPAAAIVAWFFHLWGGMVPEIYRLHGEARTGSVYMDGGNPATPAMVLSLAGAIGLFFLPFAWRAGPERLRGDRRLIPVLLAGALVGLLVGILPETSYDAAAGRWSGLWNVVARLPTVAHRSPLIVALATLGGGMIAFWCVALGRRDRWLFLAAWTVFTLAQSASSMAWQRYYEPFLLITFALAAARVDPNEQRPRWAPVGPALLALLLAATTAATIR